MKFNVGFENLTLVYVAFFNDKRCSKTIEISTPPFFKPGPLDLEKLGNSHLSFITILVYVSM